MSTNKHQNGKVLPATKAVNDSECLLSLYECIADPEHFRTMTEVLTSWLAEDHEHVVVANFERRASSAWQLLQDYMRTDVGTAPSLTEEREDNSRITVSRQWDEIEENLNSEDVAKLVEWRKLNEETPGEAGVLLLRIYRDEARPQKLAACDADAAGRPQLRILSEDFEETVSRFFATNFSLSQSEMLVVRELVRGGTLREIAKRLGKSLETVRSQVKSVTSKVGVSSQTDIVRMSGQAALLAEGRAVMPTVPVAAHSGAHIIYMPDGRAIEYEIDGGTNAKTLVFLHCLTEGRHWTEAAKTLAVAHGYRVIRISRACFGASTVNRKTGAALLQDHVSDLYQVLLALGAQHVSLFAQSSGFSVAYAFALQHVDLVKMIVGLNVSPPVMSRQDSDCLKGIFKTGALANLYAPTAAKMVARFAVRRLKRRDIYDLEDPLVMPGVNLREVESEDGIQAFFRNTDDALKQEGEGYWREASYSNVDWAFSVPGANNRPSVVLIESFDSPYTHPGRISSFAQRIGAELIPIPTFLPMISGPLPLVLDILRRYGNLSDDV